MAAPLSIENLPFEIHCLLLMAMPDVMTLFALIAASPELLHVYCHKKEMIFISTVCNQLGPNISKALCSIRPSLLGAPDYLHILQRPSLDEAKLLYRQDGLINRLIQASVNMQLETTVHLSEIEFFRLRRGMYNYKVATQSTKRKNPDIYINFCQNICVKEIPELLYMIHCLRDLAKDYVMRMEDLVVDEILDGTIQPRWYPRASGSFFDDTSGVFLQERWFINAPWLLSLQQFYDMTLPVKLIDIDKLEPRWSEDGHNEDHDLFNRQPPRHEELLVVQIPPDYRFDEYSIPGIKPHLKPGFGARDTTFDYYYARFIKAIPLGYMIWDRSRLTQFRWKDKLPVTLSDGDIKEKWRLVRQSVEYRVKSFRKSKRRPKVIENYSRPRPRSWSGAPYIERD